MATTSTPFKGQEENPQAQVPEFNGGKGRQLGDKAKEAASNIADKAKDVASNVAGRARDAASNVGQKAEDATHAVGSGIESLAGTIRENLPHSGVLGSASSKLASGLENTGRYLKEEGISGMAEDVTNMIRRNPLPAMLIGIGLGFMLARATLRR